jgi:hypothetical protein
MLSPFPSLFYLPGSLVGAFIVDYLGARNTMVNMTAISLLEFVY